MKQKKTLRKAVFIVALANLLYFIIEFVVALNIRSVSIFADSIDFIEDASINFLIFFSISLSLKKRSCIGMILAVIMLIPAITAFWAAWQQIIDQQPPNPFGISITGFGALIINCSCAYFLSSFQNNRGSLTKAAFLSARNDAVANILIIITGFMTLIYYSIWQDIFVGLIIALINANSAFKVFKSAKNEYTKSMKPI
tara:strand:- start:357 stop:950 length:594 start_codon:yes stop_codon:yes gene_type:complete